MNITADTLREFLILANPDFEWRIFALAYQSGERKAALKSTVKAEPLVRKVTQAALIECYATVLGDPALVHARVIHENEILKLIPSRLRNAGRHLVSSTHDKQRRRLSMMFRMVSETYAMARQFERKVKQRFDVVVKLRFDLKLLNSFLIRSERLIRPESKLLEKRKGFKTPPWPLVVPVQMAFGPSHLSPKQIRTRPCDEFGIKRPHWVQDHIAYGMSKAMEFYTNGTARHVIAGPQKREVRPELILAHALKERNIQVKCDPTILYTIWR
mmetsp:Transcript_23184/g.30003  ORF Transcript_23184/g.30003 Transcript_23184/m.30003 type:complete len:271 (-) Transcript_23184:109-921(-)|eukprot:CAMPEP_0197286276 /NCGR_PEP_ID=MMETSP0890-20130614/1725_1 /TAXON_ID=44058 ORGANISM="Aureoumbra lagunensis, Strain CCMP1510" /NCGR_SAMPLE_ID=MMETSP0890 /ASSEMBLY_ACC=CAM_ASM_000533 /LENGTH=270 /DNA_ID=CAMNT_0042754505 /DNA_START=340 /DNA_END=1152 /DNA_ORIENTATION=+